MRFDLLRVKSAYSMVYVSISLAFHPYLYVYMYFFFSSIIMIIFFWSALSLWIVIVICEHKRINVFMSLRNHFYISRGRCEFWWEYVCVLLVCVRVNGVFFPPLLRLSINQLRIHYYFSYGIIVYKNKADKVDVTTRSAINFVYFSDCITVRFFFSISLMSKNILSHYCRREVWDEIAGSNMMILIMRLNDGNDNTVGHAQCDHNFFFFNSF